MRPFDLFFCPLSSVAPLRATWMKSNTSTYAGICLNMVRLKGRCASGEMRLGPLLPVSQLENRARRPCAWHITLCLQLQFSFELNSLPYYTPALLVKIAPALRRAIYYGVNKVPWIIIVHTVALQMFHRNLSLTNYEDDVFLFWMALSIKREKLIDYWILIPLA